jgi:hypothetical protein
VKVNRTLLFAGLLSALPMTALGDSTNAVPAKAQSTSASATKTQIEPTYPAAQYKLVNPKLAAKEDKDKISRLGNESSQAWITIVSEQPNSTLVHNLSTHEPSWYLCSLGHEPWR